MQLHTYTKLKFCMQFGCYVHDLHFYGGLFFLHTFNILYNNCLYICVVTKSNKNENYY